MVYIGIAAKGTPSGMARFSCSAVNGGRSFSLSLDQDYGGFFPFGLSRGQPSGSVAVQANIHPPAVAAFVPGNWQAILIEFQNRPSFAASS